MSMILSLLSQNTEIEQSFELIINRTLGSKRSHLHKVGGSRLIHKQEGIKDGSGKGTRNNQAV